MEKRGKIIEKHTKLETLYKLLSGNMSGNRMDLETYVQRYYLEKILYAANRRFANMSAGQFELDVYKRQAAYSFLRRQRYDRAGGYEGYGRVWNPDSGGHIYCGI